MCTYIHRDAHNVCDGWRAASETLGSFKGYSTPQVTDYIQNGAFHVYRAYKQDGMLDRWINACRWRELGPLIIVLVHAVSLQSCGMVDDPRPHGRPTPAIPGLPIKLTDAASGL